MRGRITFARIRMLRTYPYQRTSFSLLGLGLGLGSRLKGGRGLGSLAARYAVPCWATATLLPLLPRLLGPGRLMMTDRRWAGALLVCVVNGPSHQVSHISHTERTKAPPPCSPSPPCRPCCYEPTLQVQKRSGETHAGLN